MLTPIPPDVRAFLREQIETHEELGVLLFLKRQAPGPWSMQSLCARLRLSSSALGAALTALQRRQLIAALEGGYQLSVGAANNEVLTRLAALHARQGVELIKLITSHSIERIRTAAARSFADPSVFPNDKTRG